MRWTFLLKAHKIISVFFVCSPVQLSPDRIGPLDKPQLARLSYRQEPVTICAVTLLSSHPNAGMKQYKCGRTQLLLWTRQQSTGKKRSKPKGFRQKLIITMIFSLNLNKIKNIGVDKILTPTKHWRRQNIGADKIYASTKLLASTKSWRRQNIGLDKIQSSTKSWRRQEAGADKCWHRLRRIPLLFARQSPQLLTSPRPRWRSPTSP